ncbi:MAG: DUF6659 family protein [Candidatus Nitrosopumilus sp. bin_68KS]
MIQISTQSSYKRICKKILEIDETIRFAGVINENGRLITGDAKNNIQFYVKEKDREMLFMEAALRTKMLCEFDSSLGPNNFSMYHRKNVIILEFPTGNETIYVSAENNFEFTKIPFKIIQAIREGNIQNNFVSISN